MKWASNEKKMLPEAHKAQVSDTTYPPGGLLETYPWTLVSKHLCQNQSNTDLSYD